MTGAILRLELNGMFLSGGDAETCLSAADYYNQRSMPCLEVKLAV